MIMRTSNMAVVATLACLCAPTAARAGEDVTLEPVEKWSNVFGGVEVKFHYSVRTPDGLDGRLNWSLSVNRIELLKPE